MLFRESCKQRLRLNGRWSLTQHLLVQGVSHVVHGIGNEKLEGALGVELNFGEATETAIKLGVSHLGSQAGRRVGKLLSSDALTGLVETINGHSAALGNTKDADSSGVDNTGKVERLKVKVLGGGAVGVNVRGSSKQGGQITGSDDSGGASRLEAGNVGTGDASVDVEEALVVEALVFARCGQGDDGKARGIIKLTDYRVSKLAVF